MLCQKCGKKEATTHFQQTVNGETTVYHVCGDCAQKLGLANFFDPFGLNIDHLFSGLFAPSSSTGSAASCPQCGITLRQIMDQGRVGCEECYHTFYRELAPTIEKIHGKARHSGKIPKSAGASLRMRHQIVQLKAQLEEAIKQEQFEEAAKLRDQIKHLESEVNSHE